MGIFFAKNPPLSEFITERRKLIVTTAPETRMFFWRTAQRQEVDLVEESAEGMKAFELKWNRAKSAKGMSRTFAATYPKAVCQCVTPDGYASLLM